TFYRTAAKRGSLLANVTGIIVHDHWKPYYTMTGVLHALCNAHYAAPRIMPTDAWEPAPEAVIAAMGPA
ncbi:MAG: transposase, partial [Acetobacteraceae bacterium]|nr:transposase [Acetobacteraceae bacterium]MEA2774745.1 transposase [Acetobacteraceae bacterium]